MKRIFVACMILLLAGCSGLPTLTGDSDSSSQATTNHEARERTELESLLLTLDHVDCNIDIFDYEKDRTKIRCK